MTTAPTKSPITRYLSLRELEAAGLGHRNVILRRIHAEEIPAVRIGNAFKIAETDLHLLAVPVGAARSPEPALDDLAEAARELVATWPQLTDAAKAELGRILSSAAA
ncbi:hypothetical protein ACQP1U_06355 [Actinomycetota bacterium]